MLRAVITPKFRPTKFDLVGRGPKKLDVVGFKMCESGAEFFWLP